MWGENNNAQRKIGNPDDGKTVFEVLTRVNHFTQEEFIDKMSSVTKKFRKHEIYLYWESICECNG